MSWHVMSVSMLLSLQSNYLYILETHPTEGQTFTCFPKELIAAADQLLFKEEI